MKDIKEISAGLVITATVIVGILGLYTAACAKVETLGQQYDKADQMYAAQTAQAFYPAPKK
ncbi:hypothetical protein [Pseudoxanthomonas winnipegensis]|uniref:Uncharacterized protein n=1 Tax=Pseudoxanthomonas winnipegensis TaxID=2480810 RepID=A0A4Q8M460_9GAMM|nr:hypothetical protein [Pseudoxanthomonas winnipegensis]TAA41540.1 hypothetical protein EA655_11400 [Pseudoxanthomonas winnipegensis]